MMKTVVALCALAGCAVAQNTKPYSPPSQCRSGQGKKDYDSGYRFAASAFDTNWNFLKQNCAKLDMMVDIMASTAPYKPYCKQLGYQDAVFTKYTTAQDKCFDDCKGTGKIMGETLGSQFCAITGLSAQRGFPQPPTVAICNAVEQSQCESRYAYYANEHCADAKANNKEYYNQLKKSCQAL